MRGIKGIILGAAVLVISAFAMTMNVYAGEDVAIDATNFPDTNFRTYVSTNFDINKDGILQSSEAKKVTSINVSKKEISSVKGVEYFTELTELQCAENSISSIDVSKNTKLKILFCHVNSLTSLDISKNQDLEYFACYSNNLQKLDVSKNPKMIGISCYNNKITSLDITKNPELQTLYCFFNELTAIDTTKNPKLRAIQFYGNKVKKIDVTKNPLLEEIYCNINELDSLDLTNNPKLKTLHCFGNHFSSLDLSNNTLLTTIGLGTQSISVVVTEKDGKQYIDMSSLISDGSKVTNVSKGKWNGTTKRIELSTNVSKGEMITYDYNTGNGNNVLQVIVSVAKVDVIVEPTTVAPTTEAPTTEEVTTEIPTEETTEVPTEQNTTVAPKETKSEEDTSEVIITIGTISDDDSAGHMPGWFIGILIGIFALVMLSGIIVIILFVKKKRDKEDEE